MIFNAISAASGGGGAKIATGSYVGTGTYGSSNPCSLTFDFEPLVVWIYAYGNSSNFSNTHDSKYGTAKVIIPTSVLTTSWAYGKSFLAPGASVTPWGKKSADGKTITWCSGGMSPDSGGNAEAQFNSSSYTYYYIAFG